MDNQDDISSILVPNNIEIDSIPEDKAHFFFFMNPKSGSKLGGKLLEKTPSHHFCFENDATKGVTWSDLSKKAHTKIPVKTKNSNIGKFKKSELRLINLFDKTSRTKNFKLLAMLSKAQEKKIEKNKINLFAFACGGDGTICWLVEELIAQKANFHKIVISILPFGTGNDFSVSMGFKRKKIKKN